MKALHSFLALLLLAGLFPACRSAGPQAAEKPQAVTLQDARDAVDRIKRELAGQRAYNCCIIPGCDFCALVLGKCPCTPNLAQDPPKPVCPTCYGGWKAGRGRTPGIDPDEVEMMSGEEIKGLFDAAKRTR